jgi:CheY-like chemotaxis protein
MTDTLRPWSGTGTIIVIDDEETVRKVVSRIVQSFGFDVLTAESGNAGLTQLRDHAGDVRCVLLDLTLPGSSGMEVLDGVRSLAPAMPVVLITGFDGQEAASRLCGRSVNAILQKPFTIAVMRETLQLVIG